MVDRIGSTGGLQQEAVLAALQRKAAELRQARIETSSPGQASRETSAPELLNGLRDGIRAAQSELAAADRLPEDIVTGKVTEFHEIAAQIKRADLTLKYSLEIRNKLVDAYREVMRMSV